jgi:hypothetical protein
MVSLDLRGRAGEKIEDGRHVGLDFYDLLIEARLADGATLISVDKPTAGY